MSKDKLGELHTIFLTLMEAEKLNLSDFPYLETSIDFNLKLKECLKENFGNDIKFENCEHSYIQAYYKGIKILIEFGNGIILSIIDENKGNLATDFKDIFNRVVGMEPICSYNYRSRYGNGKKLFPTVEWSLDPECRLYELVTEINDPSGEKIKDFEDNYTHSIIESLGQQLFTYDGYKQLFMTSYRSFCFTLHKIIEIQKLNPNINTETIYAWFNSNNKTLDLSQENVYQKVYLDDGKQKYETR